MGAQRGHGWQDGEAMERAGHSELVTGQRGAADVEEACGEKAGRSVGGWISQNVGVGAEGKRPPATPVAPCPTSACVSAVGSTAPWRGAAVDSFATCVRSPWRTSSRPGVAVLSPWTAVNQQACSAPVPLPHPPLARVLSPDPLHAAPRRTRTGGSP